MTYPYWRNLWPAVQEHPWKYDSRARVPNAILWHATRGNQGYDGATEMNAFVNWVLSPNNRTPSGYAGISNVGIGPQGVVLCVPLDRIPRYSSWPSDDHAISVEVAQSNLGQAIEPATIEHCVRFAEFCRKTYGIPRERVFPANDWEWRGETGHEDTVQGRAQGKTDPGAAFWTPYWAAAGGQTQEDDMGMTTDQVRLLVALGELAVGPLDSPNVVRDLADRVGAAAGDASVLQRDASLNSALREIRANLQAHIASHQTAGDHTHADIERLLGAANAFAGALDQG